MIDSLIIRGYIERDEAEKQILKYVAWQFDLNPS